MPRKKSTASESIAALQARVEELNQQIKTESQALLSQEFATIFAKYPKLKSFTWHQYTPYFNDGDECTFHVNPDSLIPDFTDEDAEEHDYEYDKKESKYELVGKQYQSVKLEVSAEKALNNAAFDEIYTIVNAIDDQTMKSIYGDHVEITISRQDDGSIKTSTEDHDHE